MIEHLKSLAIFAEVVRSGRFRIAAANLGMTPSAISYHIRVLEEAVGVPLLYRSTRSFSLTDQGSKLYEAALEMLNAAEAGFAVAQDTNVDLSGKLRVALTSALSHSYISGRIVKFARDHPNVDIHLHYDNRENNLVQDQFDIALRIGKLKDSNLLCKLLWQMPRILVASPSLLDAMPPLTQPSDLQRVSWIKFHGLEKSRELQDSEGKVITVPQAGNITVNSIEAMLDFTLLGAGVSSPPTHFVQEGLRTNGLVHLFPKYKMTNLPVFAIRHKTIVPHPIVSKFLEMLVGQVR